MPTIEEMARGSHSPYESLILAALALKAEEIPGYRDATLNLKAERITHWHEQHMLVLTKANHFPEEVEPLFNHPCKLDFWLSAFDNSYMWWKFRFPKALGWLPKWIVDTEKVEPDQRVDAWVDLFNRINALKDGKMRESMKTWIAPIMQSLYDAGQIDIHNL
jgi:hypothetical protein